MGFFDRLFGKKSLSSVNTGGAGAWNSIVHEPFAGAWQQNKELKREEVTSFYAVFSCVSLISKDVGKMPILLKNKQKGVLVNTDIPQKLRVLKKPNNFQTWQQFNEYWTSSLLLRGNTYVLKVRDVFGEVFRLVVLNPDLVKPLVSENGEVFYQLGNDTLTQTESVIVPASEIMHDRINCFYHPLVGLTPIMACGLAAGMGMNIQKHSASFFGNASRPGGILVAPGPITEARAKEVGTRWNANYSGVNAGKTAVIGDGMTYQTIGMTASDSQMLEQLKMSAEIVCSVFHVPPFKIGIAPIPAGQKVSDLNEIYYSDCLQSVIEARENIIDEGLDLKSFGIEAFLDIKTLIRMDSTSQMGYLKEGVGAGMISPNEGRAELGYLPVAGGESPMIQQQNYSLAALAKRDAKEDPFGKDAPPTLAPSKAYKGVFKPENKYEVGDFVTKNGSLWHCEVDHSGEFDHANFKLAQKKWGEI